eukprot:3108-Heterococcus_DN1.PRE.5
MAVLNCAPLRLTSDYLNTHRKDITRTDSKRRQPKNDFERRLIAPPTDQADSMDVVGSPVPELPLSAADELPLSAADALLQEPIGDLVAIKALAITGVASCTSIKQKQLVADAVHLRTPCTWCPVVAGWVSHVKAAAINAAHISLEGTAVNYKSNCYQSSSAMLNVFRIMVAYDTCSVADSDILATVVMLSTQQHHYTAAQQ